MAKLSMGQWRPTRYVRRNLRDELSIVGLVPDGAGSQDKTLRLCTLDGKWLSAEGYWREDDALKALASFVSRRVGTDKKGPRFMTIIMAGGSPFPFSPKDHEWIRRADQSDPTTALYVGLIQSAPTGAAP